VPEPVAVVETPAAVEESAGPISPLVRRMARDHSIDLRLVQGTGMGGRITKQDVEAYLAKAPAPREAGAKVRIEPMSVMRQRIAEHMLASKRTSAHVTTFHRVDMTRVVRLRRAPRPISRRVTAFRLTYLPFIARAARGLARLSALKRFDRWREHRSTTTRSHRRRGGAGRRLRADRAGDPQRRREECWSGCSVRSVDLAARARAKQLKPDEVQGGTFSITNFGSFGSLFATPVINQPQVAILGVARSRRSRW